jgi:periplasmic divalent cation tolerance protein
MPKGTQPLIVLVTAPDLKTARVLAKAALQAKLAACVNLIPRVESHYWWQTRLETSNEVLAIFKTTRPRLAKLEREIKHLHPYDTPEFVALPIRSASRKYLKWWLGEIP